MMDTAGALRGDLAREAVSGRRRRRPACDPSSSSLPRILRRTWPFTVVSLIESSRAICLLLCPSASSAITSRSRSVSVEGVVSAAGLRAGRDTHQHARGLRVELRLAARRAPHRPDQSSASTSFKRKPTAPA